MYIILKCFTCGQPIGHLRKFFLDAIIDFSQQDGEKGVVSGEGEDWKTPEYRALALLAEKHGFDPTSYCCRRTIECDYDLTDFISEKK